MSTKETRGKVFAGYNSNECLMDRSSKVLRVATSKFHSELTARGFHLPALHVEGEV